jgi:hypothetical protein
MHSELALHSVTLDHSGVHYPCRDFFFFCRQIVIVLYCIVLYCIVLYCIVFYCIVLYCIAFMGFVQSSCCHQAWEEFKTYIFTPSCLQGRLKPVYTMVYTRSRSLSVGVLSETVGQGYRRQVSTGNNGDLVQG